MGVLRFDFGIVCKLSKLAAQACAIPSSLVNTISVGIPRIVDVMGATVTAFNTPMAESRVNTNTGLRLSGD